LAATQGARQRARGFQTVTCGVLLVVDDQATAQGIHTDIDFCALGKTGAEPG